MDDTLRWRLPIDQPSERDAQVPAGTTSRFGGGSDEPVLIAVVNGPVESAMAQDALDDAGIPAFIKRNTLGSIYGLSVGAFGSAEVWTPPAVAEQARDVLAEIGLLNHSDSDPRS